MIFLAPGYLHYIRVFGGRSVFGSIWFGSFGRVCNGVLSFSFFLFGLVLGRLMVFSCFPCFQVGRLFFCLQCSQRSPLIGSLIRISPLSTPGITYRNDLFFPLAVWSFLAILFYYSISLDGQNNQSAVGDRWLKS